MNNKERGLSNPLAEIGNTERRRKIGHAYRTPTLSYSILQYLRKRKPRETSNAKAITMIHIEIDIYVIYAHKNIYRHA